MKQFKFKSIRTRLTYWFLFLTLAPLLLILVLTYFQQANSIEERTFDKLTAIRDLKVVQVKEWITERVGDLKTISTDNELTDLEFVFNKTSINQSDKEILENSRRIINRYLKNYPDYNEVFIINPKNGIIMLSTKTYMEGEDRSTDEYFTNPMQSRGVSLKNIYYSATTASNSMVYSIPIFCSAHEEEHIVGILVARIDLNNSLYKILLDRVGLGKTGENLIVNKDVVALNELRWYDNAPLNLQIYSEPTVEAAHGNTGITVTKDYRGEDILAAYTYIPETGWGFVCKQDLHELNAPIRKMVVNFSIIFLLTTIVIALIAFSISKSILSPIFELNKVAQKIGAGDFTVRNTIISDDELGSLADEFNKMAKVTELRLITQKGVSDISKTMIGQTSMQEFGTNLLKQLMDITDANMGTFYILNEAIAEYEHYVSVGANEELLKSFNAQNPSGEIGNAISKKEIYYIRDISRDTIFNYKTTAGGLVPREIITIPIVIEGSVVALISLVNINIFGEECYDILYQSWTGINTSYSNLLASERTRVFAEQLSRTNQQLEAQTEELQEQSEEMQNQAEELQRTSEELQEQNLELDAQKKQVESANKLKSEFLSNMSHELRTPLNSIMALSRVLIMQAKDKLSEEENNYLEIVERNGKNLLSLINDILDLSKIEAGKMDILPESISISSLLQIIHENLNSLAMDKSLALVLNIPEYLPNIETDESKLYQILTNIISNAIKFTEKGEVSILVEHDAENIFIKVTDSGVGISKEMLPHIFDEFRQADGTSSRKFEGTGLGLAIANKITMILGGSINVESKLGTGSTFTITLPINWHEGFIYKTPSITKTSNLQLKEKNIAIEHEVQKTTDQSARPNILIIEDNQDAIIQLKAVLEKAAYKVSLANGGQEALDYLQHTIPDGIILDLMMPDIDGFEVLEKLRGKPETKNIPVLILTAKDLNRNDLKRLTSNNIQQLIHKGDVDIEGLLLKIRLMLGRKAIQKSPDEITTTSSKKHSETRKSKKTKPFLASAKKKASSYITSAKMKSPSSVVSAKEETNILIVEDNPDNMVTVKAIIKNKFSISEAIDGEQGLMKAQSQMPDLILLDMTLPKMDGEEIVSILKANEETKNILIIAVTAQAMKGDKEKLLGSGCDGYVSKPVVPEILLAEIERVLRK